ncbi:hypothetical protein JKF63_01130 [Porcisia hertigi]|uniref:OTU domain-containing protein n=1 Tax=Porcisia hertigi TaxID=2761500 RepID=A0A836H2M9_9TRYP|nr:hypothetical protein JKF63_01130 [Porcisia hertigi]
MPLDYLFDRKIERERLSAGDDGASPAAAAAAAAGTRSKPVIRQGTTGEEPVSNSGPELCWLCGRGGLWNFCLPGPIRLCFLCFRVSYSSLVLPIINTQARRESDAAFLKLIYTVESEMALSTSQRGDEPLASTFGEVIDPQRASFVMSSSMMRRRRVEEEEKRGASNGAAGMAASTRSFWNCSRCTFLNEAPARECEACGIVDPVTVICLVCKARCSDGMVDSFSSKPTSVNKCTNGKPHCLWDCRQCGGLNTLDGDCCSLCQQLRYWACSRCTALHRKARGEDGLRYCTTCGAYNTPDDVLIGQAKIDKETKYAEMVTAQKDADRRHSVGGRDYEHRNGDSQAAAGGAATVVGNEEIVFGVNDAHTLKERERQKQIEMNEQRLLSRLRRLKISRNVQKTDGNCLFSALAHQLFGEPKRHQLVRSLVVAYMEDHREDYSILFDGEAEWRDYLSAMKVLGTWGDELCLNAAARCFRVNIHVITSDAERWHIVFQYEQLSQSGADHSGKTALRNFMAANREGPLSALKSNTTVAPPPPTYESLSLFLAYLAPVHYDDITPFPVENLHVADLLSRELSTRMKRKWAAHPDSGSRRTILEATPASPPFAPRSRSPCSSTHDSAVSRLLPLPSAEQSFEPVKVGTTSSHDFPRSKLEPPSQPSAAIRPVSRSRLPSRKPSANGQQGPLSCGASASLTRFSGSSSRHRH